MDKLSKKRLKIGQKLYGDDWKRRNLIQDMEEECVDLKNYAVFYLKRMVSEKKFTNKKAVLVNEIITGCYRLFDTIGKLK